MRLLTLLSVALASWSVQAKPHAKPDGHHHRDVAKRASGDIIELEKRFSNTRFTYYAVGMGACGKPNQPSDFIVALNSAQYGGGYPGPNCFKMITINYGTKSTTAQIMDECPGCPYGGLDMSEGLFQFFAPLGVGVLYGSWEFNDGGGSPPPPPPPPPKAKPKPAYTPQANASPHPTTTTSKPTTTSSSSSTHHSTSASAVTGEASGLAVPSGTSASGRDVIDSLNQAVIGLGGMVAAGGRV